MSNQLQLFPIHSAYDDIKNYITDPDLNTRVIHTGDLIMIHIEGDNTEYVWEQADCYYDDIYEWFGKCYPTLSVGFTEKDDDWFIISVRS